MLLLPPSTAQLRTEKRFLAVVQKFEGKIYERLARYAYKVDRIFPRMKVKEFAISNMGMLTVFVDDADVGCVRVLMRDLHYYGYKNFVVHDGQSACFQVRNDILGEVQFNWASISIPLIRRVMATTIALDLVPVQPMDMPRPFLYEDYATRLTKPYERRVTKNSLAEKVQVELDHQSDKVKNLLKQWDNFLNNDPLGT
jgi:hypothetical protein